MSFLNKGFVNNLPVEMRKRLDLAVEEGLDGFYIRRAGFHGITDVLEHLAYAGLGILELVFHSLPIEVGQVGDWTDRGEDCVVTDPWGSGSEGCYHCDAFLSTEGSEGLVVDVTTLQDDTTSLELCQKVEVSLG
jgi:hypothetical protein